MKNKHILISIIVLLIAGGVIFVHSFNQVQKVQENASRSLNTEFTVPQMQNRAFDEDEDVFKVGIYGNSTSFITSFGSPFAQADYKSPEDFTATFTSATTLTLASLGITITDDSQLVYVRVVPASGAAAIYVNGVNGVTLREAANVVTISGAGTAPFVTGDAYEVGINNQKKAYDSTNDLVKVQEQSPPWDRRTDAVELIVAAQELDATFTDLGSEIDMRGYTNLGVFLVLDIGTSVNVEVRILHKWESGGTEEFRTINAATVGSNLSLLDLYDYQVNADADQSFKLEISTDGTTPYIQLQVRDSADGDGQIDAAYAVKSY